MITKSTVDRVAHNIIGAAIKVHKELGPGLLEVVYHRCIEHELESRRLEFKSEIIAPVKYNGLVIDATLRCDLLVEDCVVVELKSVQKLLPIYEAQLLTYMRLLNAPKGIIINFNTDNIFYRGQRTLVNNLFANLKN